MDAPVFAETTTTLMDVTVIILVPIMVIAVTTTKKNAEPTQVIIFTACFIVVLLSTYIHLKKTCFCGIKTNLKRGTMFFFTLYKTGIISSEMLLEQKKDSHAENNGS